MKLWHEFEVDDELKDSWLERVNALDDIHCISVCYGHDEPERLEQIPEGVIATNDAPFMPSIVLLSNKKELVHAMLDLISPSTGITISIMDKELMDLMGYTGDDCYYRFIIEKFDNINSKDSKDQWWEDTLAKLEEI